MDLRNAFHNISIACSLLGAVTLGSACFGHSSSKVKDDQLGRLSAADREQLIDRQRDVNVAKANVDASEVALDEAEQFRDNAHDEAEAAQKQQEQLTDDLKRAEKQGAGDVQTLEQRARTRAEMASAMNAKSAYSDRLVELREAQVDSNEAEHELMEARLSRAQYELLEENDLAGDLDGAEFMQRERKAEQEFQKADQHEQEQMASARASREAWTGQQRNARAGVAEPQRTLEGDQSPQLIEAPQPPDSLKMTGSGSSQAKSSGAKNDGTPTKSKPAQKPAPNTPNPTGSAQPSPSTGQP
jgi:chromosome segregation ATPase